MKNNVVLDTAGLNVVLTSVAARIEWLKGVVKDLGAESHELRHYWEVSLERAEKTYAELLSGSNVSLVEE